MKNRKSNRMLWVLIAILLLCVCVPVVAIAEETPKVHITFLDGLNGAVFKDQTLEFDQGGTIDISKLEYTDPGATAPGCSGYEFDGWNPTLDGMAQENKTYVVRWKDSIKNSGQVVITVVYKDGVNETVFKDQVYTKIIPGQKNNTPAFVNDKNEPTTPTRDGYRFIGWKTELGYDWSATVSTYTRYIAQWEKEPEPSQGITYYPDYDESPVVTPVPTPTPEPAVDEENVSPKTGAAEVSLPALAIVALAAAALMVRMMRRRAE